MKYRMTIPKLKELLDNFEKNKIAYAIMAGYGLDGLRGRISRPHQDVDMLVLKKDYRKIKKITEDLGYTGKRFNDLFKVKRKKDGAKADLAMATIEGDEIATYGRIAITRIPLEFFNNYQRLKIGRHYFKIASNEILKAYGLGAKKGNDAEFAKKIKVNPKLFERIRRVMRDLGDTGNKR